MTDYQRSVCIGTPSLTHSVCLEYLRSVFETTMALAEAGIGTALHQVGGDQFIAKARNRIVGEFLALYPDTEALFFIDDDIGWPAAKVVEFMQRPEDIVCGVYPKKCEPAEWPASLEVTADHTGWVRQNGMVAATMVPGGFMRIRRRVLERLWAESTPYEEMTAEGIKAERRAVFEAGVNREVDPPAFWGEDMVFGQRCRLLGYKLWIDPDIRFTHRGNKVYRGTFADAVAAKTVELRGTANGETSGQPIAYRPGRAA